MSSARVKVAVRTWFYRSALYPLTDLIFRRDSFSAFEEIGRLQALSREKLSVLGKERHNARGESRL